MEILELTDRKLRLRLRRVNAATVNALRRAILDDVPSLAIDVVEVHHNTSVLNDDLFAHKLGLIPIDSRTVSRFRPQVDCNCEDGCARCQATLTLNVKNDADETRLVTSLDLKIPTDPASAAAQPDRPNQVLPVTTMGDGRGIAVAMLGRNQQMSLTARVCRGTGKQNAKWNPSVVAAYRPTARITLDDVGLAGVDVEDRKRIAASCPSRVFETNAEGRLVVANPDRCTLCLDCVETAAQILADKHAPPSIDRKESNQDRPAQSIDRKDDAGTTSKGRPEGADTKQTTAMTSKGRPEGADTKQTTAMTSKGDTTAMTRKSRLEGLRPLLTVDGRPDEFLFVVETTGALDADDVLHRAVDAIIQRLLALRNAATPAQTHPQTTSPSISASQLSQ